MEPGGSYRTPQILQPVRQCKRSDDDGSIAGDGVQDEMVQDDVEADDDDDDDDDDDLEDEVQDDKVVDDDVEHCLRQELNRYKTDGASPRNT